MNEAVFLEELKKVVSKACEDDLLQLDKELAMGESHVFSEEFNRKMKKLLDGSADRENPVGKGRKHRIPIKYLLIAAILMILAASTVLAIEPIREKLQEVFITLFPEYANIQSEDETSSTDDGLPLQPYEPI